MLLESFLVGRRALCRICGYYRLDLTFRWLNIIEKSRMHTDDKPGKFWLKRKLS